jgi:hypothetical protein
MLLRLGMDVERDTMTGQGGLRKGGRERVREWKDWKTSEG